jgi:hypothetical protein
MEPCGLAQVGVVSNMDTIDKLSVAGNAATKADQEFFQNHPDQKSYRRKVIGTELSSSLNRPDVRAVHVSKIEGGFWKIFIDANGQPLDYSIDFHDSVSAAERLQAARIGQAIFDFLLFCERECD